MFTFSGRSRRASAGRRRRLGVEALESRDVPATQVYATGAGPGGGPHIITRGGKALNDLETFNPGDLGMGKYAYPASFSGGVFVG